MGAGVGIRLLPPELGFLGLCPPLRFGGKWEATRVILAATSRGAPMDLIVHEAGAEWKIMAVQGRVRVNRNPSDIIRWRDSDPSRARSFDETARGKCGQ